MLRVNPHGGHYAGRQRGTLRYLLDVDVHRRSPRQLIRLRVWDVDATGKAANVTVNGLAVTH